MNQRASGSEAARPNGRRVTWRVHAFGSVGSTNDVARRLAQGDAPEGTIVLAETQASGRGRRGSVWHSPAGGLWFSVILRPHLPPERAGGLSIVAAVAVAKAVTEASGVETRIKWPNDVYVGPRKLAGIMIETAGGRPRARRQGALVLGVGINVNVPAEALPSNEWYEATSLECEAGRRFMRGAILARIIRKFEPRYFRYRSPDHRDLIEEWRELSLVFGEQVEVTVEGRTVEGTVHGLEDDGGIVVRLPAGRQEKILPLGDVTLRVLRGSADSC
jgi:BirA family biotin operon repressor/biotin-[acetyl-CoA-carboxylase] ligase